jgi:hypothetical protein
VIVDTSEPRQESALTPQGDGLGARILDLLIATFGLVVFTLVPSRHAELVEARRTHVEGRATSVTGEPWQNMTSFSAGESTSFDRLRMPFSTAPAISRRRF